MKLLEVCAYSVKSALNAQEAGAQRVELCSSIFEGGTTPPQSAIMLARKLLGIKLHIIIRPRGGDFYYSALEFEQMLLDVKNAKDADVDGIVIGLLNQNGTIDIERTSKLIKAAYPMSVTFHRAFDMTENPFTALETLIELGVNRILTSGQKNTAYQGRELIAQLIEHAKDRIIIMPGSGINPNNIEELLNFTKANEFHVSAKKVHEGNMLYRKEGVSMGPVAGFSEYDIIEADTETIKNIINIIRNNN